MSVESFRPIAVEVFGGLCTLVDAGDVPPGLSPDCADLEFFPGGIRTRPGTNMVFPVVVNSGLTPVNSINGIKSYVTVALVQRLLEFNSDGTLYKESAPGTLTLIASGLATDALLHSTTLFGREWMAFNDGRLGIDIPRVYDDAFFDRVGAEGPGDGTLVVDSAAAGNVSPGAHQCAIWYETRNGGWTKPSPASSWTAAGGKQVVIPLPLGPPNVKKRLIGFTAAGGARFFHMPDRMVINDNTTTTVTLDFTDSALLSGANVDHLFRNELIPSAAGVASYEAGQRLAWWGEPPAMQTWKNLSFDGGFIGTRPSGWSPTANSPGGSAETVDVATGAAYKITGNGVNAVRGEVNQNALADSWNGLPLIQPNKAYRVRARVKKSAGLVAGHLGIDLFGFGASGGGTGPTIDTVGLTVTPSQATTSYQEYEAELTPAQPALPSDLKLRIFAWVTVNGVAQNGLGLPPLPGTQNPLTNNEYFLVDELRIWPSDQPNLASTIRWSRAAAPELNDGLTGLQTFAENNGQSLRTCFESRDFFYAVKDRSIFATQNVGDVEPSQWPIQEISNTIGTPSIRGVDVGDGWAVIADRTGLYKFIGASLTDEDKMSLEIQGTWDRINFEAAGHKLWVRVQKAKHRILVGVPLDDALDCSHILVLDYTEGWANGMAKKGHGRKWTIWNLAANCASVVESPNGPELLLGSNLSTFASVPTASGKIFELKDGVKNDDDGGDQERKINGYYDTYFLGAGSAGSAGGHSLFGTLTFYAIGSGAVAEDDPTTIAPATVNFSIVKPDGTLKFLGSAQVMPENQTDDDFEMLVDHTGARASIRFETDALDHWMQVSKLVVWAKPDPWRLN